MILTRVICRRLLKHAACCALRFELASAGNNIAAKMAIMAMTTSNSIKVNPFAALKFFLMRVWMIPNLSHGAGNRKCENTMNGSPVI